MAIPREHFAELLTQVPLGEERSFDHCECPAGMDTRRRLRIRNTDRAYLIYCFNCGGHSVVPHGTRSYIRTIKELLADQKELETKGLGDTVMPGGLVSDPRHWPVKAQAWVGQYITTTEAIDNEITYSHDWQRVILPVYEDGKLIFWQARAVHPGQSPKYISVKGVPKPMAWKHSSNKKWQGCIVIVEDILSAIKVSRVVDSVALLGTSPDIDCLSERLKEYNYVGIVLDPDAAGTTKSIELHKRLSLVCRGKVIRWLGHTKQPKEMDNAELEAIPRGL